jgi:hypothetical protein
MKSYNQFITEASTQRSSQYKRAEIRKDAKLEFPKAIGHISWKPNISGSAIFALDNYSKKYYSNEKMLYRLEDPIKGQSQEGGSIVKINAKTGMIYFTDNDKMGDTDKPLVWSRPIKYTKLIIDDERKFSENQ